MAREHVESSLEAVESALSVLAASLEQAGFAAGADAYRQMADVVLGQRLWTTEQEIGEFDERFATVGHLATRVYEYLAPYTEVAARLAVLTGTAAPSSADGDSDEGATVDSLGARIVDALRSSPRPLPATRIGAVVGVGTTVARRELDHLVAEGVVTVETAGGRSQYRLRT